MLWCCEYGSYAIDFTPERWEVVATFCVGTNSRQRFLRYPNFHHKLNFYEWTFSRAQFDSYECGQCCRHKVCQRGSPFWAIPWLARNTISCLMALSARLGLTLLRLQNDWNTHQTLNISHIWYDQRENGLHAMVLTSNASPVTVICRALWVWFGPLFTHRPEGLKFKTCGGKIFIYTITVASIYLIPI